MKIYTKKGDKGNTGVIGKRVSKSSKVIHLVGDLDELNSWLGKVKQQIIELNIELSIELDDLRFTKHLKDKDLGKEIELLLIRLKNHTKILSQINSFLIYLNETIFAIGAIVACANIKINLKKTLRELESSIDDFSILLPKLTNFILPSGNQYSSDIHIARSVCRRVERNCVEYFENSEIQEVSYEIISFLNRLSDWLFTIARLVDFFSEEEEQIWKPKK